MARDRVLAPDIAAARALVVDPRWIAAIDKAVGPLV
jgi:hypothetical protein